MGNEIHSSRSRIPSHSVQQVLTRFIVFSLLWFALAGSNKASWGMGIPAVLCATALSLMLASPFPLRISLTCALRFIPFFLRQSFSGALDVMRRALSFQQLLDPGLISYTTLLPEGSSRIFFVNSISLLPGTLSAELNGNRVTIHTIDQGLPIWANIQRLEYHVAALMCISLQREESS
ncbi:MAG: Na+/H+ antiporter subunit E [Desulfocapsa sp.]|nr:Na+/H+ antiporter subunit E [Desulfocapsa sp.]